ncbi:Prolyl 4hydroxylase, alpha subunit [Balamuthia mandrillaris]
MGQKVSSPQEHTTAKDKEGVAHANFASLLGSSSSSPSTPAALVDPTDLFSCTKEKEEDKAKEKEEQQQLPQHRFACLVRNVLTEEECAALIEATERLGYDVQNPSMKHEVNRRCRLLVEDPALSSLLFSRLQPFLPLRFDPTNNNNNKEEEEEEEEQEGEEEQQNRSNEYSLVGLNERLRFCRYAVGQSFSAHQDAFFKRNARERSFITCMVYLNGGFEGGATQFLEEDRTSVGESDHEAGVLCSIRPEPGLCLLFDHNLLHEGCTLLSGEKYILRTEVMYRRRGDGSQGQPVE